MKKLKICDSLDNFNNPTSNKKEILGALRISHFQMGVGVSTKSLITRV